MLPGFAGLSRTYVATTILLSFASCVIWSASAAGQESDPLLFGVAIRNSTLEKRFARQREEQEPVSKFLLNSNVTGSQTTVTKTRLRIVPDEKALRFELLNSGTIRSLTTGINRQALVESTGNQQFEIIKQFWFDGSGFLTVPCHGTIQASQTPQRVVSAAGVTMPLLSPLSDRVAWNEVIRQQPEINRVVAEDVSRDVLPKVDRFSDEDFAQLGRKWKSLQKQASDAFGKSRFQWAARSTNEAIFVWTQKESTSSRNAIIAIPSRMKRPGADEDLSMIVSERAVNGLIRQYIPAGFRLTDTQLNKLQSLSAASDSEAPVSADEFVRILRELGSTDASEAAIFSIEFTSDNPLAVRFVDGDIRIVANFKVHPKIGSSSGWMTTSFNLRGNRLSDQSWAVAVRSVDVGDEAADSSNIASEKESASPAPLMIPTEEDKSKSDVTTVQAGMAGMAWIPIIRAAAQNLSSQFPPMELPLEFEAPKILPPMPRLRLVAVNSANGMLRIGLRIVDRPKAASQ